MNIRWWKTGNRPGELQDRLTVWRDNPRAFQPRQLLSPMRRKPKSRKAWWLESERLPALCFEHFLPSLWQCSDVWGAVAVGLAGESRLLEVGLCFWFWSVFSACHHVNKPPSKFPTFTDGTIPTHISPTKKVRNPLKFGAKMNLSFLSYFCQVFGHSYAKSKGWGGEAGRPDTDRLLSGIQTLGNNGP